MRLWHVVRYDPLDPRARELTWFERRARFAGELHHWAYRLGYESPKMIDYKSPADATSRCAYCGQPTRALGYRRMDGDQIIVRPPVCARDACLDAVVDDMAADAARKATA